ncbi:hypothetical protein ACFLSQ_09425 [Bacteroidota bacterium]
MNTVIEDRNNMPSLRDWCFVGIDFLQIYYPIRDKEINQMNESDWGTACRATTVKGDGFPFSRE